MSCRHTWTAWCPSATRCWRGWRKRPIAKTSRSSIRTRGCCCTCWSRSLTTFEVDHKRAERARANFSDAGLGKQALVLEQDAVAGLEKVDQRFDACFIDLLNGFPSEDVTRRALELCLQRLEGGALLMADNALRQGEVARPKNQQARNVAHYNELVAKHPRLESVVIPIRDGLSVPGS